MLNHSLAETHDFIINKGLQYPFLLRSRRNVGSNFNSFLVGKFESNVIQYYVNKIQIAES